jgi:ABC-2 type transport system permease protein
MRRNPARIIEILVWPGIEVVLFAVLASSQHGKAPDSAGITLSILTGIVFWNCTARVIQETTAQFTDDFTSKNIQSLLITPIRLSELLIGITAASISKIILSLSALSVLLSLIYPSFFDTFGPHVFLWVFQLELVGVALSYVSIAAICIFGERVGFIGWMISTVLQIFSLVFYDRAALPPVLHLISYVVPSSYIFEAIRSYTPGVSLFSEPQMLAFLLSCGYAAIGIYSVALAFRLAKHLGTFAKI